VDLVVSPTVLALNTQTGSQKHAMTPGQLIDALVLEFIDATTVRLAVAESVIEVKTDIPLVPGSHVRLAARGHGDNIHWVIVGAGNVPAAPRGQEPARAEARAPAHPAAPATEVTIGGAAVATEGDVAATTQPRPDQAQTVARPLPSGPNPAVEFVNATRSAAARQSGLAPLFAELKTIVAARDVPVQVKQVAVQVLAAPVSLDKASGDILKQAISRSGLFLEARLAGEGGAPPAVAFGDLKAALFSLKQALQGWLDALPPSLQAAAKAEVALHPSTPTPPAAPQQTQADLKPPPPYRGAPTTGQPPAATVVTPDATPMDVVRTLLAQTDGAIARQVLMQVASLPDAVGATPSHADGADKHWNLEIPFVTPQGTAIAHFEIQRDGRKTSPKQALAVAWRANFSLDFEPMGPIHAQIALTGKRAAVNIWAERKDTAAVLRSGISELSVALQAAALDAGDVIVRDGAPPRPLKASPGRFLDRAS
jgi:hypothetical protein